MKKQTACPVCRGRGTITVITGNRNDICGVKNETCLSCGGTGMNMENVTNADRIRAMSDEELAVWTMKVLLPDDTIPFCQNKPECEKALDAGDEIEDAECIGCLLEWLRQPAEGGEQERAYRVDNFRDCRKKEANRMALIDGDVRRINHE